LINTVKTLARMILQSFLVEIVVSSFDQ